MTDDQLMRLIDHLHEGVDRLRRAYPVAGDVDPATRSLVAGILPYTARYWVKGFEKCVDAAVVAEVLRGMPHSGRPLEVLDVGSGSGQMIGAIVAASGRAVVVDALDNCQEADTDAAQFMARPFARAFIVGDFTHPTPEVEARLGRYDAVVALNSIRMAADLAGVFRALARYLRSGGLLVANVITPRFHERFFADCRAFAQQAGLDAARYETARNYIPNAYSPSALADVARRAGLTPVTTRAYLVERGFRVYDHFPVGYQLSFPFATYGAALPPAAGRAYASLYAEFLIELAARAPAFITEQLDAWRAGADDGLHAMAVCTTNPSH